MPISYTEFVRVKQSPLLRFLHENAGWGFSLDELIAEGFRDLSDLPPTLGEFHGVQYYGVERVGWIPLGPLPPVRARRP
jgi:hypothetical protein